MIDTISLNPLVVQLADSLCRHILPLFISARGRPSLVGTGLLLRSHGEFFVLSAAHVLQSLTNGSEIFFYVGRRFRRKLSGRLMTPKSSIGAATSLVSDVRLLKLEGPCLPPYPAANKHPLPVQALRPNALPRGGKKYFIIGFPGSRSEIHHTSRTVISKPYAILGESLQATKYHELGCSQETHILIGLARDQVYGLDGATRTFPSLKGMSGSPIWLWYDECGENDSDQTPVVGILTEYHKAHRAIIAIEIGLAVNLLNDALTPKT